MKKRASLGQLGPDLCRLGYGAMVLEGVYGDADEQLAIKTLHHAFAKGMMIDTSDAYGNGHNESLICKAMQTSADEVFIASKFGIVFEEGIESRALPTGWGFDLNINATPQYVEHAIDASLARLGRSHIDLWYVHFPDPGTDIEVTVKAMAEQVKAGKVRYLGLSNVSAEQVRKAHAIHPIHAVQFEYSLWRREVETSLLPTLRELGIALVPWSPLGAGFLTGTIQQLESEDFRQQNPKFSGGNFIQNRDRFAPFMALANTLNVTPAQLALSWLLHQGDDIFPIPGTRQITRIDENYAALDLDLSSQKIAEINHIAQSSAGGTLV